MLVAGVKREIPVIVGSAGGSGAEVHLQHTLEIVREIVRENDLHFTLGIIHAEIDKELVRKKLREGKITPMRSVKPLTEAYLDKTIRVVGQMGAEPIIQALNLGAEVVIAGRSFDPAMFAAHGLIEGFDPGLVWHMGKILECGALCARPSSASDCLLGYLREDHFVLEPTNPARRCTSESVAAHTLYEKPHPYLQGMPGGTLDMSQTRFYQLDERRVKVEGSRFIPSEKYYIKLEGAAQVAYRTIVIAGIRDPIMIANLEEVLNYTKASCRSYFSEISPKDYEIYFHIYGKDGVMGSMEFVPEVTPHELGIILEVVATTQQLANTICAYARSTMLHYDYTGRKATAGNLAFPFAPSDVPCGPVYKFTIYHLMEVDDPCELFPVEIVRL